MLESVIQRAVIIALRNNGWLVVKHIQTNLNGWPDLQALKNGRCVFIEVKGEKGKLSQLQSLRHEHIRKMGFEIIVVRNDNDIKHLL